MSRQSGFAYLFLLFLLALLAISALAVGSLQHYARIRSNEAELLRIGAEFRRALRHYHEAATPHVFPRELDDLLLDQRTGADLRHLRKVYVDPITNQSEWGLVLEQGRIVGVHPLSERSPLKVAGFAPDDVEFERAERYSDWVFRVGRLMADPELPGVDTSQRTTGG